MSYNITLKNAGGEWTSPTPDTPLGIENIESAKEVTTLDLNVYVDLLNRKKQWNVRWGYMSKEDYDNLRKFYDDQFESKKFPEVKIPDLGVDFTVARMTLNNGGVATSDGTVEGVEITLRETIQTSKKYNIL